MSLRKYFGIDEHKTTWRREIVAGITTYSTIAYALIIIPIILADAGMDLSSSLIATILTAAIATFVMGAVANYPFAVVPGIGMSAYLVYSVVKAQDIGWQEALGIVFWSGASLLVLWALRLRETIIKSIPHVIKSGAGAGIGLFLVLIGLKGTKVIVSHPDTLLALGNIICPEALLTAFGILVLVGLTRYKVKGAILIAVLLNWLIGLAWGLVKWKGIVALPTFQLDTAFKLDFSVAYYPEMWMIIFSFLFVTLFDSGGSLMGLAEQGNFLTPNGKIPRLRRVLFPDALGTAVGGLLGSSATVLYVESASGIAAGARTGITAITISLLFIVTWFFEPLISSIPIFAITPVLIFIGALMMRSLIHVDWEDPSEYIPAFVTAATIPFTYSIGTGIGLGIMIYPLCKLASGKAKSTNWFIWVLAALFACKFIFVK